MKPKTITEMLEFIFSHANSKIELLTKEEADERQKAEFEARKQAQKELKNSYKIFG